MIPASVTHTAMKHATAALLACLLAAAAPAFGQAKTVLRISTPAVPDDWHVKMLYVFRDELNSAAPGRFDVQVHHSGTSFARARSRWRCSAEISRWRSCRCRTSRDKCP